MRIVAIAPTLLFLTACTGGPWQRAPKPAVIDKIESEIVKVPCVGPVAHWERHYIFESRPSVLATILTFGTQSHWFDYNHIELSYFQAGAYEFRSRRVIDSPVDRMRIDDRPYEFVYGDYDLRRHRGVVTGCGANMSPTPSADTHIAF